MSKAKFEAAKELIGEKDYAGARAVLKTIDHPLAREWEAKLEKLHPVKAPVQSKPIKSPRRQLGCVAWTLIVLAFCFFITLFNPLKPSQNPDNQNIVDTISANLTIVAGGRHIEKISILDTRSKGGHLELTIAYLTTETNDVGYAEEWIDLFTGAAMSIQSHNYPIDKVNLGMGSPQGTVMAILSVETKDLLDFYNDKISRSTFLNKVKTVTF